MVAEFQCIHHLDKAVSIRLIEDRGSTACPAKRQETCKDTLAYATLDQVGDRQLQKCLLRMCLRMCQRLYDLLIYFWEIAGPSPSGLYFSETLLTQWRSSCEVVICIRNSTRESLQSSLPCGDRSARPLQEATNISQDREQCM